MSKPSIKCGDGTCILYDKHDHNSHCFMYDDRRQCSKSMKKRKRIAKQSQERAKKQLF